MTTSWRRAVTLLGDPEFRKVWSAGWLTMTVRWMETLAIGVYTHEVTQSAFMVAIMLFARMCPTLLLGAFSGAIAERVDRRALLLGGIGVLSVVSGLLAFQAFSGRITLWHIAIGAIISGVFWSFEFPTRRTLLGDIAGLDRIGMAMGFDSGTGQSSRMIGPPLGGLLLEAVGLTGPYLVAMLAYTLAFISIARLQVSPVSTPQSTESVVRIIADGFAHIRTNQLVAAVLVVTVLLNFFGFSYAAMVPVIGENKFHLSAFPIGVLVSMEGLGALFGSLFIAFKVRPVLFPRVYLGGTTVFLVMLLAFAISPWYPLSLVCLFLAGIGLAGFATMQSALIFSATTPHMRRRVMGVVVVCIGAGPLGVLHTGALGEWFGAEIALRIIACEGLLALIGCSWYWPVLHRRWLVNAA